MKRKSILGGLALVVGLTGCTDNVGMNINAKNVEDSVTTNIKEIREQDPILNSNREYKFTVSENPNYNIEFTYKGTTLSFACGTEDENPGFRAQLRRDILRIYAEVQLATSKSMTNYDLYVFTRNCLDPNGDKIITPEELNTLDDKALRPSAEFFRGMLKYDPRELGQIKLYPGSDTFDPKNPYKHTRRK